MVHHLKINTLNTKIIRKAGNPTKYHVCKNDYGWNPASCICENGRYARSIIDESVITCDKIIEQTKTHPTRTVAKMI